MFVTMKPLASDLDECSFPSVDGSGRESLDCSVDSCYGSPTLQPSRILNVLGVNLGRSVYHALARFL
jgi:hypothetical protein